MDILVSSLASLTKKSDKPFKTKEEFQEALIKWLDDQRGTAPLELQKAQTAYVIKTLSFIDDVGLEATFKYHQACLKASAHIPPLYNPMVHGGRYIEAYLEHVDPLRNFSSKVTPSRYNSPYRSKKKLGFRRDTSVSASATSSSDRTVVGTCRLHKYAQHTNAECHSQNGGRGRSHHSSASSASQSNSA
jgi:hypothetical protein